MGAAGMAIKAKRGKLRSLVERGLAEQGAKGLRLTEKGRGVSKYRVLFISPAKLFVKGKRFGWGDIGQTSRACVSLQAMTILGAIRNDYDVYFIDIAADGFHDEEAINKNLCRFGLSDDKILERVRKIKPHAILITSMFAVEQIAVDDLCSLLKRHFPDVLIIVGGMHATAKPEWHFEKGNIDYIVLGEGEDRIEKVLKFALEGKGKISGIEGIAYQRRGSLIIQPQKQRLRNLDRPWEFEKILFDDQGKYRYTEEKVIRSKQYKFSSTNGRTGALYGSRGCPFGCKYCCTKGKDGLTIRHMGGERMFRDVAFQHENFGVNKFQNQADTLGLHGEDLVFLKKVARYRKKHKKILLENTNAFPLRAFFNEQAEIKREFIGLLSDAGFRILTIAIETFAQRFNNKIDFSKMTFQKIKELILDIKNAGMKCELYMMYCFPDQTAEELIADKRHVNELSKGGCSVVWRALNYFPGSQYYQDYFEGRPAEKIYREKVSDGVSFYNITDFFNLSRVKTEQVKEIVGAE